MRYSPTQEQALKALRDGKPIDGFRSSTIEALERRGAIIRDGAAIALTDVGQGAVRVEEQIRVNRPSEHFRLRWTDTITPTLDIGQTDYVFWDRVRRGQAEGLGVSGLFLKTLASKKAAWVLGDAPRLRTKEEAGIDDEKPAESELAAWWNRNHDTILHAYEEAAALGDCYIVINPDLSAVVVPPHVVEPIVDESDYSRVIGQRIRQVIQHPQRLESRMVIEDEWYADRRIRRVTKSDGRQPEVRTYRNLVGEVPVIHIPNNRDSNSRYGHSEGEALVQVLHNYGAIFDAARDGNLRQGRPTPVMKRLGTRDNIDKLIQMYGETKTQTVLDEYGNEKTETWSTMAYSPDELLMLGGEGEFSYEAPGSFTADTMNLLQILFYMIVQFSEMPEFVFGNAIASSQASAETQMPPFVRWIEKEQGRTRGWMRQIVRVVLGYLATYTPGVNAEEEVQIIFQPVSGEDNALVLQAVELGLRMGILDEETALAMLPLGIENVQDVLEKARQEREPMAADDVPFAVNVLPNADTEPASEPRSMDTPQEMQEAEHTGVMVAFRLPRDVARQLNVAARQSGLSSAIPVEEMHITLAYLGDRREINITRERLEQMLESYAASAGGIAGVIGGIGRFNASENSDGKDVIYASFDAPDLAEFRQSLVAQIEGIGGSVSRAHGFTPHITLAYVDPGVTMPPLALPTSGLKLRQMSLFWGGEVTDYPLGDRTMEIAV